MTQARRLGLWTLDEDRRHLAATPAARPNAPGCVLHWGRPIVQRAPGTVEDPIQNVLQYVAACRPYESALAIWESALNKRLVDPSALERLPFVGQARRILAEARPFSDSGLETLAAKRLRWLGVRIVPQAHLYGRRVDVLIGARLVLQIDGATHTGAQRDADNEFDAILELRGYHVIRVSYRQIIDRWHDVQMTIMEAVTQGLHLAV